MRETDLRAEAKKRAEEKLGFYIHLTGYIVVNVLLFSIWIFTGKGFPWIIFPIVGWGIGILMHFLYTFVFTERKFLDRMTEKEYEKMKKERK
jgi:hypothetical protein